MGQESRVLFVCSSAISSDEGGEKISTLAGGEGFSLILWGCDLVFIYLINKFIFYLNVCLVIVLILSKR